MLSHRGQTMVDAASDLRSSVARFRAAHAARYLSRLAGEATIEPHWSADLEAPCLPRRQQAYRELETVLSAEQWTALGAHMLRAVVERAYGPARALQADAVRVGARTQGEPRPLRAFWNQEAPWRGEPGRTRMRGALREAAGRFAVDLEAALGRADQSAACALSVLRPGRHPDAGPEQGGASVVARRWLDESAGLMREALARLGRAQGMEVRREVDVLTLLRGGELRGFVPREGCAQRVGRLWEALGLRDALTRHVRLGPAHCGPLPAAQVVVRQAGRLVILPSVLEAGVWSELTLLEATGRALGYALVSPALPVELRHPTVASVARALGGVGLGVTLHPRLWKQRYGASSPQALALAQHAACALLCHSRLAACAALGRGQSREQQHVLAAEALTVEVAPEIAQVLLARISPGGSARALCAVPGLIAALRDRFDEDWYRNPRAAEPLRGAAHRGGALSVEGFAEELGVRPATGLSLLAELF